MKKYSSRSAATGLSSGVKAYETGPDYIRILFRNGQRYLYTYGSCGRHHVESMKALARAQKGLSTYVSQHHPAYASRERE